MECEQARNLFDTYLGGELSGSLAAEFGAHKLDCPTCRRDLALLEVAGHVIAADSDAPLLGEEFTDRLLACALGTPRPRHSRRRRLVYIGGPLAAAACLVLMVSAWPSASSAPASNDRSRETLVLDAGDEVGSEEQLLQNVKIALTHDPYNVELQKAADALRLRVEAIANGTKDGAFVLENSLKETIMEILESIQIDSAPAEDDLLAAPESSGDDHDQPVEDL